MMSKIQKICIFLGTAILLTGCGRAPENPDTIERIDNAEEFNLDTYCSQLPETLKDTIKTDSGEQNIDAAVICTMGETITEGLLQNRIFSEEEIKKQLEQCGYAAEGENITLSVEDSYIDYYNSDFAKGGALDKTEDTSIIQSGNQSVQNFLMKTGIHQSIQSYEVGKRDAAAVFSFATSAAYESVPMEWSDSEISFSGIGEIVNNELASLSIISDFSVIESSDATLLSFDTILEKVKELLESETIKCVSSGQAINKIQLYYWVEKTDEGYKYYPVWDFEVPYTADWLKGMDITEATRYVVLDASTGELVDYNNGGAE